jgi:hypothetical protein
MLLLLASMNFYENLILIDLSMFRWPVIISIENHCSREQRFYMSQMLIEIFGGKFSIKEK